MQKKQILIILILFLAGCGNSQTRVDSNFSINFGCNKNYGLSFPPFADQEQIDFSLEQMDALDIERIRIAIDWRNREPQQGEYYWEPMDYRMKRASENNISVLLSVPAIGPEWACGGENECVLHEDHFRRYVKNIVTRYNIDKIQFGNEWEERSAEDHVRLNNILYNVTKEYSPQTQVVLGGITRAYPMIELYCNQNEDLDFSDLEFSSGYSEEKLLKRVEQEICPSNMSENVLYVFRNAKYEMIDIQLYDDPLNWPDYIKILPGDKPIIVSEFGGPSSVFEKTNQKYQAKRLKDYLETIESLPIEEAYHFKLVDTDYSYHKDSGLFDKRLKKKEAYEVFQACT